MKKIKLFFAFLVVVVIVVLAVWDFTVILSIALAAVFAGFIYLAWLYVTHQNYQRTIAEYEGYVTKAKVKKLEDLAAITVGFCEWVKTRFLPEELDGQFRFGSIVKELDALMSAAKEAGLTAGTLRGTKNLKTADKLWQKLSTLNEQAAGIGRELETTLFLLKQLDEYSEKFEELEKKLGAGAPVLGLPSAVHPKLPSEQLISSFTVTKTDESCVLIRQALDEARQALSPSFPRPDDARKKLAIANFRINGIENALKHGHIVART